MFQIHDIPLINYVEVHSELPNSFFKISRKSKKLPIIYSLLSKQYANYLLTQKKFLISQGTLLQLKEYLSERLKGEKFLFKIPEVWVRTLTIPNERGCETYIFILTTLDGNKTINILKYQDVKLISWLGGVIQEDNDVHISVQHNLSEDAVVQLFNLFDFFLQLSNLKDFERIFCHPLKASSKNSIQKNIPSTNLLQIDISNIREYIVPAIERKEHYRWQFCGPGRTILKLVKVRRTIVKEYIRKGKRI